MLGNSTLKLSQEGKSHSMNPRSIITSFLLLLISSFVFGISPSVLEARDEPVPLIERYRRALSIDAHNPTLQYQLGVALLVEDKPHDAIVKFQRAYPSYTDSMEMNYNMGLAYSKIDDPDSAVLYFEQAEALGALQQQDRYPLEDAYFNLGLAYLNSDLPVEAEQLFNKVLSINPDRIQAHHALGKLYILTGHNKKAIAEYEMFLAARPSDQAVRDFLYATYYNTGLRTLDLKSYEEARENFNKALLISPNSNRVRYTLAHIDSLQGNQAAAIDQLTSIYPHAEQELQRNIRVVIFNSALALQQRKGEDDLAKADQAVSALLAETPADTKTLFLAGNIALSANRFEVARERYETLLDIDPGHEGALVNLSIARKGAVKELVSQGRTFLDNSEYRLALSSFETALAIDPSVPEADALASQARTELENETSALLNQGKQAFSAGEVKLALDYARKGLRNLPKDPRGVTLEKQVLELLQSEIEDSLAAGSGHLLQGDLEQARSAFDRVLELDAGNSTALTKLELVKHEQQEAAGAIVLQAEQALKKGDLLVAEAAYRKALALQPDRLDATSGLATTQAQRNATVASSLRQAERASSSGDFIAARKHLNTAYKLRPNPEIKNRIMELKSSQQMQVQKLLTEAGELTRQEEFTAAENLYQQALKLSPDSPQAQEGLSNLTRGRSAAIENSLNKAAVALQNQDATTATTNYRKVLYQEPTNQAALSGLKKAKQLSASKMAQLEDDAKEALKEQRFTDAETAYRKLLELDPYHASATVALERIGKTRQSGLKAGDEKQLYLEGIKLYTSGRYQDAIASWQQVLRLDPDHEKSRMNIEKSQRKLRMIKERKK